MIEDLIKKYDEKSKVLSEQVACLDKENCDTFISRILLSVYREFLIDLSKEQEKEKTMKPHLYENNL